MRTAVIGPFPPYRGGIAQFSHRLYGAMVSSFPGNLYDPVSFSRLYPAPLFPGTSQRETGASRSADGCRAEEMIDSLSPMSWRKTRRTLKERSYDGFIVQWWHPFFSPSLSMSLPGSVRTAAVCHNVIPHEGFPGGRLLSSAFLRRADLLVVHSESDEEHACALVGSERVLRLFHPVYDQYGSFSIGREASRERFGYSEDDRVVLFFGLIREYKGLEDLIAAMSALPPDVKLLIAGECYMDSDSLQRAIAVPELAGRVIWDRRFIPDQEVAPFFDAADIVALPYRSATQSGVAQIAVSFGKPLVLTDTGGLSELVDAGSTGFLAASGSPSSIRNAIVSCIQLSEDPDTSNRVRKRSLRFSWENYASSLTEALG